MKKLCLLLVIFLCGLTASRPRLAGQSSSASFPLEEATAAQLQDWMAAGTYSARQIAELYLKRIEEIDRRGPTLRSVIEVNPDALTIADRLDSERREKGPRGPLHGVPILIKDNIDTADRMMTTAGSLALEGSIASRDAFIVERLRAAGAVILGKTNLSEWANFRSTRSTSGWSARGGLVKNPYALDRNPCGSSSGTGAAIAANLGGNRGRHRNRRVDRLSVGCQRTGRDQADCRPGQPVGHHSDCPQPGHSRPDGPDGRAMRRCSCSAMSGVDVRDPITRRSARYTLDRLLEVVRSPTR